MTVAGAANCKLNYELKGDGGMWTVFEETQNEGRIRGIIEWGLNVDYLRKTFWRSWSIN